MKVLYVVSEPTPSYGGIGSYSYKIIERLIKKYDDLEALLVTCNQHQPDSFSHYFKEHERVKILSLFDTTVNQLSLRDIRFQLSLYAKIYRIIKSEKIDLIHHQSGHYELFLSVNLLNKIPKIMTSHGDTFTLMKKWKDSTLNNFNESINYYFGKFLCTEEKFLYNKSTKIIPVADHVKKSIIENYKINSTKISTIHNFVDPDAFYFHAGSFKAPYKIGFIGRPYYIKGFYDLIDIIKRNDDERLVQWHLVTDVELVRSLIEKQDNIVFYKNVPQAELSKFYDDIDIMIIPSYSEACPTVLLESLLKGKFCIVRDIIGINEILSDCIAYRFSDMSQLDINEIIKSYANNKQNIIDNLKNNRANIKKRYDPNRIIDEIYKNYRELIS